MASVSSLPLTDERFESQSDQGFILDAGKALHLKIWNSGESVFLQWAPA